MNHVQLERHASGETQEQKEIAELRKEIQNLGREISGLPQINVSEQMQEIKILLHDLMRDKDTKVASTMSPRLRDIEIKLRAAGVKESIITEISESIKEESSKKIAENPSAVADLGRVHYLNLAITQLFKGMNVTGDWNQNSGQRLIALVGPTGVGKTTSIAKIAARLQLTYGKKVTLISTDTFRIGASDQLRVYSKILGCGFVQASSVEDLEEAVVRNFDSDFIFIDTAGFSVKNSENCFLNTLRQRDLPIEYHLTLAATMNQRNLDENYNHFRSYHLSSLIFTKLDESWSFGEILNSAITSKVPMSYFSIGQKVPEDLEVSTKERVVERIFRL